MKKVLKILLIVILAVILVTLSIFAFLTFTEYKPDDIEYVAQQRVPVAEKGGDDGEDGEEEAAEPAQVDEPVTKQAIAVLAEGSELTLLTYDIGYAGLSADMDTVVQGGEMSKPASKGLINRNLDSIASQMNEQNCDIYLLQSVDKKSDRSYKVDMVAYFTSRLFGNSHFAEDFKCKFLPMPINHPQGSIDSGVLTLSKFDANEVTRHSLPSDVKWPFKTFDQKSCMLVERIPLIDARGRELVIINTHFSDSDDTGSLIGQPRAMAEFMLQEYSKGNFVIAGGSFNRTFPNADPNLYPIRNTDAFIPGTLEAALFSYDWNFAYDESNPTARLTNQPYSDYDPYQQLYVIDGFITSPNVTVKGVYTVDTQFKYSSHNPVKIRVILGEDNTPPEPEYEAGDELGEGEDAEATTGGAVEATR